MSDLWTDYRRDVDELPGLDLIRQASEGRRVLIVAPTAEAARDVWRELASLLAKIDGFKVSHAGGLVFMSSPAGGSIVFVAATRPEFVRGMSLDTVVLAGLDTFPTDQLLVSILPALMTGDGEPQLVNVRRHALAWTWSDLDGMLALRRDVQAQVGGSRQ